MPTHPERDYILGTHDEEIERLGLQHRVWRPKMLECWRKAGITTGSRVMDVGAGPGYATIDLAEIVGPMGQVFALERSERFVQFTEAQCKLRGLTNVQLLNLDLMLDSFSDITELDATWCRWVAAFVSSPSKLVASLAHVLKPGGVAIFHEYIDYRTYRLAPRKPAIESFVHEVMKNWRESGGEPDIALELPHMLHNAGFAVRQTTPIIFTIPRNNFIWQWPSSFIETHLQRLLELGKVDEMWVDSVRRELREAEADPSSLMITPLVLEIVAEKIG
ncbi:MAG: methyltransferase domain-containing protein [Ignavibacteriae bacterium]|nr:methyltransferase domain-containing protein [Ignavibacteriota bacterium]